MTINKDLKIVLFGDAPMAINEGGVCQTLYNLFDFIEPENFLGITAVSEAELIKIGPKYQSRYLRYQYRWIVIPFNNRFTKYFVPLVEWINFSICQLQGYKKIKKKIIEFDPDIIIACSNSSIGIAVHAKLLNGKFKGRVIPYFMDDWMCNVKTTWLGGSLQGAIKQMLTESNYWMMIGKELSEILQERYNVVPRDALYVRNPVDITTTPPNVVLKKDDVFTIAYAGALWPMHYDSFYAFAKAVQILSASHKIQLKVFSPIRFWEWRKSELEPLGVIFGGHLDYAEVHTALNKANALLLTSSFEQEFYTHSRASIQTKITDYCLSKRLIISCGPDYSANHNFIKKYNCGVCIETIGSNEIAVKLADIVENIDQYQEYVDNGWNILELFSKPVIHQKIEDFLNRVDQGTDRPKYVE